jgi:hypothetical protein
MDIDLPQIAVVGIQSSGKSSVLEKFIGRWVRFHDWKWGYFEAWLDFWGVFLEMKLNWN